MCYDVYFVPLHTQQKAKGTFCTKVYEGKKEGGRHPPKVARRWPKWPGIVKAVTHTECQSMYVEDPPTDPFAPSP